jgi:hypothetical protein
VETPAVAHPLPNDAPPVRRIRPGASRRGLSVIWVAIACSLAFASALVALYYWTDWKDHEQELQRQEGRAAVLKDQLERLNERVNRVMPFTGLARTGEGQLPTQAAEKYLRERQEESLKEILKLQEKQISVATLENCAEVAGRILDAAIADRDRAKAELERRKLSVASNTKRAPYIAEVKSKMVEEIQKKTQEAIDKRTREETAFAPEVQKMEEMAKKEDEERAAVEAKHRTEMLRIENEISELKRRLEEVKQREVIHYDIIEVHGEIIEHDIESKFAFINIGSANRVVNGLRFLAALPGDYGRPLYKGEVEVKRVWPHRSEVRILSLIDPSRPILKGDILINPLFDTRRPKIVAFAGDPASRKLRFNVNEATRRILEIQSVVKSEATVDLDFLITTDAYEADKNFLRAVELQIPIASGNDVLKFLGP